MLLKRICGMRKEQKCKKQTSVPMLVGLALCDERILGGEQCELWQLYVTVHRKASSRPMRMHERTDVTHFTCPCRREGDGKSPHIRPQTPTWNTSTSADTQICLKTCQTHAKHPEGPKRLIWSLILRTPGRSWLLGLRTWAEKGCPLQGSSCHH